MKGGLSAYSKATDKLVRFEKQKKCNNINMLKLFVR